MLTALMSLAMRVKPNVGNKWPMKPACLLGIMSKPLQYLPISTVLGRGHFLLWPPRPLLVSYCFPLTDSSPTPVAFLLHPSTLHLPFPLPCCCCSVAQSCPTLCRHHGLQHAKFPCSSSSPGACSNSCPLSQRYHPTISSSVIPFSSCLLSFPASGSFPMSWPFASGGQSIGASASVPPKSIQG